MKTASYYQYRKHGQPIRVLVIEEIDNGQRTQIAEMAVTDKRHARAVAAEQGAKCWNF